MRGYVWAEDGRGQDLTDLHCTSETDATTFVNGLATKAKDTELFETSPRALARATHGGTI